MPSWRDSPKTITTTGHANALTAGGATDYRETIYSRPILTWCHIETSLTVKRSMTVYPSLETLKVILLLGYEIVPKPQ